MKTKGVWSELSLEEEPTLLKPILLLAILFTLHNFFILLLMEHCICAVAYAIAAFCALRVSSSCFTSVYFISE